MNIAVISYSMTGNNQALAKSVAEKISAEHIIVTEDKPRSNGTIIGDLLLGKTPKVRPAPADLKKYDAVILAGPVWIGKVATPLRAYLRYLKKDKSRYAFISISGGALGPNPKLGGELTKRTGRQPEALVDLHIAGLMPGDAKAERKDTSAYRLTAEDVEKLTDAAVSNLGKLTAVADLS